MAEVKDPTEQTPLSGNATADNNIPLQNTNQTADADEVAELQSATHTPPAKDEDEDDDPDAGTGRHDAELSGAQNDAERTQILERRKTERKSRGQRTRERIEAMARENAGLREQLQQVVQTVTGLQQNDVNEKLGQVDASIAEAEGVKTQAAAVEADAITKGDGARAVQARQVIQQATDRVNALTDLKTRAVTQLRAPAPLDANLVRNANVFKSRNPWYQGPNGNDPDSAVLTALDAGLMRDGLDPRTAAYWQELEARGAKYLPHRYGKGYNAAEGAAPASAARRPGSADPVAGSGGGNGATAGVRPSGGGSNSDSHYVISAERVRAMKEAGAWEDPKRKAAMIDRFKKFDADNRNA